MNLAMFLQLFIIRSKQPFANVERTIQSFTNKYLVPDPVIVDSVMEINEKRNKIGWYGVVQDCEYIEEKLCKQIFDFLRSSTCDFLIAFKPLPLENRIVYQPRFMRYYVGLGKNWDVQDRRPLPYKFARCYRGFILDHPVRCDDAQSLIR